MNFKVLTLKTFLFEWFLKDFGKDRSGFKVVNANNMQQKTNKETLERQTKKSNKEILDANLNEFFC